MDNPTTEQQHPTPPYSWFDAIQLLIDSPTPDTLHRIVNDEAMTAKRAYLWVALVGMIFGMALAWHYPPQIISPALWVGLPAYSIDLAEYQPPLWTVIILGMTVGSINTVIGFMAQTLLLKRVSLLLGADHDFEQIAVLRGLFYPMLLLIRAIVLMVIGYNNIVANTLFFVTIMLDFIASSFVLRLDEKLTLQKSMLAVMGMNLGLFIWIIFFTSLEVS